MMKQIAKLSILALFTAAATATAVAQETYTDSASNLNIALTGYVQGELADDYAQVQRIRITTKDVINAVGGGPRDKLVILTPVDYDGATLVVIRSVQNRQNVDTDISGYFGADTYGLVENSRTRNGRVTGTQYSIDNFYFGGDDTEVEFDVQGLTTANLSNGAFSSNVNGFGSTPAGEGIVSGRVSASGGKYETFTIE